MFRKDDLEILCCPKCKGNLKLGPEVLTCAACARDYPLENGIPRLLYFGTDDDRYNESWDFKWTVLDGGRGYNYDILNPDSEMYKIGPQLIDNVSEHMALASIDGKITADIGCGIGQYSVLAAMRGAKRIYALDLTRGVDVARRIIEQRYPEFADRIVLLQGNARFLPLKDCSIEVGMGIASLHHSGYLEECIGELTRAVRENGHLMVWVYAKQFLNIEDATRDVRSLFRELAQVLRVFKYNLLHILVRDLPHKVFMLWLRIFSSDFVYRYYYRPRVLYKITQFLFPMLPNSSDKGQRLINLYDAYSPSYAGGSTEQDVLDWAEKFHFRVVHFFSWRLGFLGMKLPKEPPCAE